MKPSSKLVFFGTETFSVPSLRAIIEAGYHVVAVVTKPDTRRGRGKKVFTHPVKELAALYNIPVLQPERLRDIESELQALQPATGVLVSYGKIIPERILDLFEPVGIINIHPSALPKYRGPSPLEATILAGDKTAAVSIMKLDSGMDTGPVFVQQPVSLQGTETKPELSAQLAQVGADLLVSVLPDILSGVLKPKQQKNNDVSVTSLISKQSGILDPTTDDALTLERKIRAYQGYPKPRLIIHGNDVVITSAKCASSPINNALVIPCANESYLEITELIAPSGRTMSGTDYIRGYVK